MTSRTGDVTEKRQMDLHNAVPRPQANNIEPHLIAAGVIEEAEGGEVLA